MPAPKDPEAYALWIERLRESHRGHKHSAEHKAKIGEWTRRTKTGVPRPDMRGDGNPMRRPAVAAKMGAHHRGKPKSPEQRLRIAESLRGRFSGEANGHWLGEDAKYHAIHNRAKRELPRVCAHCGTTEGRLACALRKDAPVETIRFHTDKGRTRFSVARPVELAYMRLCPKCHVAYDRH